MSDKELAGQVIVAGYAGTEPPVELVEELNLAGVIVMGDNYVSVDATREANSRLQHADDRPWPLVISVDQEGGIVSRIGKPMTQFPTYMSLGASGDLQLARRAARANGEELRAAGFTMVFAPDADVTVGASDPTIGSRSAGDDAEQVAAVVAASTRGYVQSGIVPVLKHFPGHGSVTSDSHLTLPHQSASVDALERRDFRPFQAAVGAGAPAVMMAHISVDQVAPGVPADLSPQLVGLLREDVGFGGLIVTDALEMQAVAAEYGADESAVAALRAGSDLLLMPPDAEAARAGIVAALHDGSLERQRVEDAAAKVVALMMHEAAAADVPAELIGSHEDLSRAVSARALTVVDGSCQGPYVGGRVTASGDPEAVRAFDAAAAASGLQTGSGTSVALIGAFGNPASADIVISLDTPYVLASSSAAVAKLALFGSTRPAMDALVAVLTGQARPRGRLPVAVPGLKPPAC
ncbi:MAG: glycoside hydrolase family 3 protein [Nocardioidaceae bacterium]